MAVRAELVHPAQQGQLEAQEERGRLGLQVSQERQDLVVVPVEPAGQAELVAREVRGPQVQLEHRDQRARPEERVARVVREE